MPSSDDPFSTNQFLSVVSVLQLFPLQECHRPLLKPLGSSISVISIGGCRSNDDFKVHSSGFVLVHGAHFFMITGFHGLHVSAGVIYLLVVANRVRNGFYDQKGNYDMVEISGLYWHFVDLVWVFIFAFFYLW